MALIIILGILLGLGYLVVQYQEKQKTQEVQRKIEEQNYQKQTLENFLEEWAVNEEPIHNKDQGYPIDWKVRRQAVLLRDNFACSVCQKILGYRFCIQLRLERGIL